MHYSVFLFQMRDPVLIGVGNTFVEQRKITGSDNGQINQRREYHQSDCDRPLHSYPAQTKYAEHYEQHQIASAQINDVVCRDRTFKRL